MTRLPRGRLSFEEAERLFSSFEQLLVVCPSGQSEGASGGARTEQCCNGGKKQRHRDAPAIDP